MILCDQIKFLETYASIIPVPVYWVDKDSRVLGANKAVLDEIECDMLEEIIGKTPYDLYPHELADKIVKHNKEVFKTKKTLEQEERINVLKTGKMRHYISMKRPLFDEDGKVCGLVGVSMSTTKEKERAQLELETARKANILKLLESIADSFPTPVYWNDLNSVVLGVNKELLKALGNSAENVVGKEIHEFHSKEMADAIVSHNKKVIATGMLLSQEEVIRDVNTGQLKYFDAFKAPLCDENGKIIGILGTSIDITDKKRAAELEKEKAIIEATNKHLKTMAGSIAHELRNPLGGIKGAVTFLKATTQKLTKQYEEGEPNIVTLQIPKFCEQLTKHFAAIERDIKRGLKCIEMQLANIKGGDKVNTTDFTQCSMTKIVEEALIDYPFEDKQQRVLVHWRGGTDFNFHGHPDLSHHILSNFLSNALHYIKEMHKGEITIWLENDSDFHYLHFRDTAKGMSPEAAKRVFEQFYSKRRHGTGLGLTFCQDLVHASGGEIYCTAEEGKYAQFTLRFPQGK